MNRFNEESYLRIYNVSEYNGISLDCISTSQPGSPPVICIIRIEPSFES